LPSPLISYPIGNNYNGRCTESFVTIENDTLSSRSQREKEIWVLWQDTRESLPE